VLRRVNVSYFTRRPPRVLGGTLSLLGELEPMLSSYRRLLASCQRFATIARQSGAWVGNSSTSRP